MAPHTKSLLDKLEDKILVGDGCWEWTASKNPHGYGTLEWGDQQLAHRIVYELLIGPIPAGTELDHTCRNRGCVKPSHLEPVPHRENVLRGDGVAARNAAKTHCPRGHAYDDVNTELYRGKRYCLACRKRVT